MDAGSVAAEAGVAVKLLGEARVTVSRFLGIPPRSAKDQLDHYLQEREAMIVLRRLPDRVIYERGAGVGAAVTRAAGMVGGRHPLLNLKQMEVTVSASDERSCFVALSVDLGAQRAGAVAGVAAGGLVGAAAAGATASGAMAAGAGSAAAAADGVPVEDAPGVGWIRVAVRSASAEAQAVRAFPVSTRAAASSSSMALTCSPRR